MNIKERIASILLRFSNKGMVYFGHGICESKTDPYIENLHLHKDGLVHVIKFWKRIGVKFITMQQLAELSKKEFKHRGPWIHFTFDDGYRNNLYSLLPIMERYNIPFTIFVTTDFIGKNTFLPATTIRIAILHTQKEVAIEGHQLKKSAGRDERINMSDSLVRKYKYLPTSEGNALLSTIHSLLSAEEWDQYKIKYKNDLPLSHEELNTIASNPLCHIAAHTHTHNILHASQPKEIVYHELAHPIDMLSTYTDYNINALAFPNGTTKDFTQKTIKTAQDLGYQTIFTTIPGFVTSKTNSYYIPRYVLTSKGGWILKLWIKLLFNKNTACPDYSAN